MKARVMNRVIEIPDERISGSSVRGAQASRGGQVGEPRTKDAAQRNRSTEGQGNVKSGDRTHCPTIPGWPKPSDTPFSFELLGQIPSGKNAVMITRTGRRYPSKRFKAWRDDAIYQLTNCDIYMRTGSILLIVDHVPGNKIRRDVPGMLDAICHLLEYTGIVQDDAQIKNVQWHQWPLDREHPKCRVTIEELT